MLLWHLVQSERQEHDTGSCSANHTVEKTNLTASWSARDWIFTTLPAVGKAAQGALSPAEKVLPDLNEELPVLQHADVLLQLVAQWLGVCDSGTQSACVGCLVARAPG